MKRFVLPLLVLLLLPHLDGCATAEPEAPDYPIQQEALEEFLEQHLAGLGLRIDEKQTHVDEVMTIYNFEDTDGFQLGISSGLYEGGRSLQVFCFLSPHYDDALRETFLEEHLEELAYHAGLLIGSSRHSKQVARDFLDFIAQREPDEPLSPYLWVQRYGDYHYRLQCNRGPNTAATRLSFVYLQIVDRTAYERNLSQSIRFNLQANREDGHFVRESVSSAELPALLAEMEATEVLRGFITLEGRLRQVEQPEILDGEPNRYRIRTALLVDETGSLAVQLAPTSLTAAELKQPRRHLLQIDRIPQADGSISLRYTLNYSALLE